MNWLLIFVPIAIALEYVVPHQSLLIFAAAAVAIIPLASWMGRATEHIAERTGEGVGGLLNATFGNAAELIIGMSALRAGLYDVVKASLVGSIIGNILLVLGASMLAGGIKHSQQQYNSSAARSQATMLTLAVIALILPAAYQAASINERAPALGAISVWISLILIAVYSAFLVYSLITHRTQFAGLVHETTEESSAPTWSMRKAGMVLASATAAIAWISEILVGAIEPAAERLGLNDIFVGVFVVAILGNAAEHSTAIIAAMRNRMDLSLSIAIGSSVQIALFVAPLLVLLSYVLGPGPMDLAFSGGLVLTVILAVWISGQLAGDGRSDWLRGIQLLAVYLILGLVYLFMPGGALMAVSNLEPTGAVRALARKYCQRQYAVLFYSLLATIAAGPLIETVGLGGNSLEFLLAFNLLAAVMPLRGSAYGKLILAALLALLSIRLGAEWLHSPTATLIVLGSWTILALLAAARAVSFALRATAVDGEHLYAAADAYVLAGLFLGVFYWVMVRTWPEALIVTSENSGEALSLAKCIYFSFVTLATLGYGDIVPNSEPARGVAVVEAVAGQLYLAVMIAHLVSLHVRVASKTER